MTSPAQIRAAGEADAAQISGLFRFSDLDAWTPENVQWLMREQRAVALIAEAGAEVAGAIIGSGIAGEAEIYALIVNPAFRKQGWGRRLLTVFTDICRDRDIEVIHLEVAVDNAAALALYRQGGFAESGRRPGYYHHDGKPVDALLMSRRLQS